MFRVKVVGTYVARSGIMAKERIKKDYEVEGNIPTINAALSIVKNKLLGPALSAKYPDYVTFLTYHIVEITPLDPQSVEQMNKAEIKFMDRKALVKYVKDNNIGACSFKIDGAEKDFPRLEPAYYPDLFRLREAVQFAKDDPEGYQRQFILREPDLRLDLEMAQCNPELFANQKTEDPFIASAAFPLKDNPIPEKPKASSLAKLNRKTGDRLAGLQADQIRDGEMGPADEEL